MTAYADVSIKKINKTLQHGVLYMEKPFSVVQIQQIARMLDEQWTENQSTLSLPGPITFQGEAANDDDEEEPIPSMLEEMDEAMVTLFYQRMRAFSEELSQCLKDSAWEEAGRIAHNIKGVAGSFGYPKLSEIASLYCTAEHKQQKSRLPGLCRELLEKLNRIHFPR